ncbi:MAG: polysaccharide biosynthesis protein [Saprospiraceae bacterium]|nr:polysaccharide biosynthesis protein [Saprospiraceae bacterium]
MVHLNINDFIAKHVTERSESLFKSDLKINHDVLQNRIDGRSVLVIGGAGTIGSSFIKALLEFKPGKLYIIDINENGLTELTRDLRSSLGLHIPEDYKTYPIDFGDNVFEKLLHKEGSFDIVANFAAHKHVRSEKDHYSIEAMIENNVLRTKRLLEILSENPPRHFFCVSTDKAANPVNVMGASKKLMEEVLIAYAQQMPIATARFANVAFSNGSLPDGFLQRLMKRQPLSAPLDVKRYFVSPQESGELCLLACVLGEPRDIFFPKLAETQMKTFSDIGTALLREIGYEPDFCQNEEEAREKSRQWAVGGLQTSNLKPQTSNLKPQTSNLYPVYYFESDTSGEKPYEEFYTEDETVDASSYQALGIVKGKPNYTLIELDSIFSQIQQLFQSNTTDKHSIVQLLTELLPNFQHIETGKNLDQKM